jgi:hypothetical protein
MEGEPKFHLRFIMKLLAGPAQEEPALLGWMAMEGESESPLRFIVIHDS